MLRNSYFSGNRWVGGVAGYIVRTTVDTAYSDAQVVGAGTIIGGIVGNMCRGTVNNCWFAGTAKGTGDTQYTGGIVGKISDVNSNTISNCLTTGTVISGKKTGNAYAGGILGGTTKRATTITNCLSAAQSVSANGTSACLGSVVGGVDQTTLTVTNVYALKGICNDVAIGSGAAGTVVSGSVAIPENINGGNAVKNTELDFGTYWIMMTDSIPVLKSFVASDDANIRKPDAWVTDSQGTKEDPYIIVSTAELLDFASRVNGGETFTGKYFVLRADIEFNTGDAKTWGTKPPAMSWTPIGSNAKPFKGHFGTKGEIREITGLYVNQPGTDFVGLFGAVIDGSVKNIKVTNSYFSGKRWVGGISGYSVRSVIDTTYSDATVISANTIAGGIVGNACAGTISNSWYAGTVTTIGDAQYTGGIVGKISDASNTKVENCLMTGSVQGGKKTGNAYVGGIVGGISGKPATVKNCISAATSVAANGTTSCVGSVIGGIVNSAVTASNNYGVEGVCNNVVLGTGAANGSITEQPTTKTKQELQTGYATLLNTEYWTVDTSKYDIPVLKDIIQ